MNCLSNSNAVNKFYYGFSFSFLGYGYFELDKVNKPLSLI